MTCIVLCLAFQIRLKQIMELAITVKHMRCFVDNLILPILLGFLIILKDKLLWNRFVELYYNIFIKNRGGEIISPYTTLFKSCFLFLRF